MSSKSVAIIILHWGSESDTRELLSSLKRLKFEKFKIFLVDQTSELKIIPQKNCEILRTHENLGFTGGNNLAIKKALDERHDYVLLLNNDTSVSPDFLSILVDALETRPNASAAGPEIAYYDSPDKIWYGGGTMSLKTGTVHHNGVGMKTSDSPKSPSVVRFITGCSILIRSSALIEVGALDDRYFVYSEDADWCARAQKSGGDLLYVPNSKILHKISSSLSVNSPTYLYYILRNNLLFIRLNVPLRWRWLAWLTISLKSLKEIVKVFARYRHDYRRYLTMIWLAYYHNSKRRYGQL